MENPEKYCFFCLKEDEEEEITHIYDVTKLCKCNPSTHLSCLIQWYVKSGKKCPVCLEQYRTMIPVDNLSPICARRIFRCIFITLCLFLFLVFILIVLRSRL